MNWQAMIGIAVLFAGLYQVGTSATSAGLDTPKQVQAVQVGTSDSDITKEITEKALSELEFLFVNFQGNIGGFGFIPEAFTAPFVAQVDVSTTNTSAYPDDPRFAERYPAASVTPIGPLVTLQVPYNALTRNDDPAQRIVVAHPVLYQQYRGKYEPTDPVAVEVRVLRPAVTPSELIG